MKDQSRPDGSGSEKTIAAINIILPNAADIADVHPIQLKPENAANVAGYWVTSDLLLRSACWYAATGRPVFPCQPWDGAYSKADAKAPLTAHGFHDATTDVDLVYQWWTRFPFAMIGSPVPVNELCLDIDPRNEGDRWALVEPATTAGITCSTNAHSGN